MEPNYYPVRNPWWVYLGFAIVFLAGLALIVQGCQNTLRWNIGD